MSDMAVISLSAVVFAAFGVALYRIGGRWADRGADSVAKYTPYACGEDLSPEKARLSYRRFFRLALMFVVAHLAALVVTMLPLALNARLLATVYLLGVGICVDVLVRGED